MATFIGLRKNKEEKETEPKVKKEKAKETEPKTEKE